MKRRTKLCGILLFFLCFMAGHWKMQAEAALVQTGTAQKNIRISWEAPTMYPGNTLLDYKVYIGPNSSEAILCKTLKPTVQSLTIKGLQPGMKYYVAVRYSYQTYRGTVIENLSAGSLYDAKTLPGQVKNLHQDSWYYYLGQFYASWDPQTAAEQYQYVVKTNTGKVFTSGKTSGAQAKLCVGKVSNDVVYSMRVRAISTVNGKKRYGAWSATHYFFTQPRITAIKFSGSGLKIQWQKVRGAQGYDIYLSRKEKEGYKKAVSTGGGINSSTIKKWNGAALSPKKKYYLYVVARKGRSDSGKLYYWNTKDSTTGFF